MEKITREEFLEKFRVLYGDKYDYTLANLEQRKEKIIVYCKIHQHYFCVNVFEHTQGVGCTKCSNKYKMTTLEAMEICYQKCGDIYLYDKFKFTTLVSEVVLGCVKHKIYFSVKYNNIIYTKKNVHSRCPKCVKEFEELKLYTKSLEVLEEVISNIEVREKELLEKAILEELKTQEKTKKIIDRNKKLKDSFITKAMEVHNNFYDYSLVEYKDNRTAITIVCPIHGNFKQKPGQHLAKCGCYHCGLDKIKTRFNKTNFGEFVTKANEVHLCRYEYDETTFIRYSDKTKIYCKKCQKHFDQTPSVHLRGVGCPNCNMSRGELKVEKILISSGIEYVKQYKNETCKRQNYLPFDFAILINSNVVGLIEYNGKQHYEVVGFSGDVEKNIRVFEKVKENDLFKSEWVTKNDIPLLVIKYNDTKLKNIINDFYMKCERRKEELGE